jgi:crotonobetainyl-CoA:carnitine CoA-transferase CaiB-like acyl-CoA transferase
MSKTTAGTGDGDLPLSGIRVVDLTRALAGPFCTALLGDLGADVIKVEGLPDGDATRAWPPLSGERSLYYLSANRNKRSIALDLRSPDGRSILADLVTGADVLVENFRPGVLVKLGLDRELLRCERPDLVIASVSGFGEVGPMRHDAGLDQVAQGMSGLMSVTGAGDQTPMRVGVPIIDMAAGMFTALGIVASLVGRAGTGRAPRVNTSLLESAISLMTFQAQRYLSNGEVPAPQGNDHPIISPYGTFHASDQPLNVAVGSQSQWAALCGVLGAPHLMTALAYAAPELRVANKAALYAELNELFGTRSAQHWLGGLRSAGVPCGPIYALDQVFADPQVQALEMVQRPVDSSWPDDLLRGPLWIDGHPSAIHRNPPELGEHTREVLGEIGYARTTIDHLLAAGVIAERRTVVPAQVNNDGRTE